MAVDAGDDLAFLRVGIGGDGEVWALEGGVDWFRGRCAGKWNGRWVDESDSGGGEFWSDWIRGNGGLDVVEGGVCFSGGRHVVVVWKCWWR